MPRCAVLLVALLCGSSVATTATDKRVIFNHVSGSHTASDNLVHDHYDKLYTVVDVQDQEHTYTFPKGTSGFGPIQPVYVQAVSRDQRNTFS
jgi:hypothetical protein